MSYSNFKDPVGLAKRMLLSRNKVAHFTLLREGLSMLCKPIDILLQSSEKKRTSTSGSPIFPVIFILGGSRTGTTLLYQMLAQCLEVSYFNNLSALFPKSPLTASKFFAPLIRKKSGDFKNYFGSVSGFGGPNDGFHIWNRWLGEDRNSVPDDISFEKKMEMRSFFASWQKSFPKPFLNKNNRNSLCVKWFEEIFEDPVYIEIRRDPLFVVQSLAKSRKLVQGDSNTAWGLKSKNTGDSDDPLKYLDDICEQVVTVENILDDARSKVPEHRYLQIRYVDLCENPTDIIKRLAEVIGQKYLNHSGLKKLSPFKSTNQIKLSSREWKRVTNNFQKIQFSGATLGDLI